MPLLLLFFPIGHSFYAPYLLPSLSTFQASIGMGTRRVRSAVQVSFNVAQGSVREPHRECAEEDDTPPSSSSSSRPASEEERGQLTASSPFPLPSRPFVVRPERSCGRSKAAHPNFLFCCTCLMDCCELLRSVAKCCCLLTLSCKYFPSPIILSSYQSIIHPFAVWWRITKRIT